MLVAAHAVHQSEKWISSDVLGDLVTYGLVVGGLTVATSPWKGCAACVLDGKLAYGAEQGYGWAYRYAARCDAASAWERGTGWVGMA